MDIYKNISNIVKSRGNLYESLTSILTYINNIEIDTTLYPVIENNYTKYTIYQDNLIEVIVIAWDIDVITGYHKHPKNGCILKVLNGKLTESVLLENKINNKKIIKNSISYIDDKIGIHSIKSLDISYTLHIYSPPGFYNEI